MKWRQSYRDGESAEQKFATVLKNAQAATTVENIHEHWDLKDKKFKYDVKSMKRWNRSDKEPTDRIHFIEFKNVRGHKGWLYGKADYIVFETRSYWILILRQKLQDWIEGFKMELSVDKELYKLYTRKGRKDLMTVVPTMDLIAISEYLVKK